MKKIILLIALLLAISTTPYTYASEPQKSSSAQLTPVISESKKSDIRIVALENMLKKYHSPLADYAPAYVKYADKYGVDWKLLPSISGVESTFGKFYIEGTYNAYGWGSGQIYFKSWEDGIDTINKTLKENYMDKWGAQSVWEIGPIYAESKTWSPRVAHFMDELGEEYIKLSPKNLSLTI